MDGSRTRASRATFRAVLSRRQLTHPTPTYLARNVLLDLRRLHVVAATLTVRNVFHVPPLILMIPTSTHLMHAELTRVGLTAPAGRTPFG